MSPRSPEENRRARERTRQRLVSGSFRVFAEKGAHGASMSDIAETVGVSKGLAYHYFDSKEELLAAALEARLDRLLEVVEEVEAEPTPGRRLEVLTDRLIGQVTEEPEAFRLYLALSLEGAGSPALGPALEGLRERMERYLGEVRRLFEELGSPEPPVDALLFRSALLGLCVRSVLSEDPVAGPEVRNRLLELFGGGG